MASIGELFKVLGNNEVFNSYCQDTTKTNIEIVNESFDNAELMLILRNIVQDDSIIKSKMDIIIGQKRKNANKPKQQEQVKPLHDNDAEEQFEEEQLSVVEFKFKPLNPQNVIYLNDYSYLERVDHRTRLVTLEHEMYY
jgi:hypothetical protein